MTTINQQIIQQIAQRTTWQTTSQTTAGRTLTQTTLTQLRRTRQLSQPHQLHQLHQLPQAHQSHLGKVKVVSRLLLDAACEVLWPTRCALCDTPGDLICHTCKNTLPYLDQLEACPACGAPWGRLICTECNSYNIKKKGLSTIPLDGCASALVADEESVHLITLYKDGGEQRLATLFADLLTSVIAPHWCHHAVIVPIPATKEAHARRGFDHVDAFAKLVAQNLQLPYAPLLQVAKTGDQRKLDGAERLKNMKDAFTFKKTYHALATQTLNCNVILIDDVFTTGATLYSAANLLRKACAHHIYAATLVRV